MSVNGEETNAPELDYNGHQAAYIFAPSVSTDASERPVKRRKVGSQSAPDETQSISNLKFEPLLNGLESSECVELREELYKQCWSDVETRIQSVLDKANQKTLSDVTSFFQNAPSTEGASKIPTAFIATGPNIASQSLLFQQLSNRLQTEINGPVVILRSGDASNLKAALKQVIRDATNQRNTEEEEEEVEYGDEGRKLLNYDLEILHGYIKARGCRKAVVAFQDSEAFDPVLLADMVTLFNSWTDRIPFVLLFGIATSVDLFSERLSRAASRCLSGVQFDVEQTSTVLESVFQEVVIGSRIAIRLGPGLVSGLMERQHDHVQSVQAFTTALKYAYMCHFYANPLAILCTTTHSSSHALQLLQSEHLEAIRSLPSFRDMIENLVDERGATRALSLMEDNDALMSKIQRSMDTREVRMDQLFRQMSVLSAVITEPLGKIELYLKAMKGTLGDSDALRNVYDNVKRMSPDTLLSFTRRIEDAMRDGSFGEDNSNSFHQQSDFLHKIAKIHASVTSLSERSEEAGVELRSSYAAHSKALRATVVAQKVQLSYEKSTLSAEDLEFTSLVDEAIEVLKDYFTFENPQHMFLSETWMYDLVLPYKDVFTPRPRFAIERALTSPQDYLPNCQAEADSLSSAKPPTANLYQMYLESGTLINISDLWTAFHSMVGSDHEEGCNERMALMLFYRGLADLKLLGMVKQSKKKVDHLAKSAWSGL